MDMPEPSIVVGVQDLYARYAHRIDRRDFDGFGELFTDNANFALGDTEQHGRDAIREFMRGAMKAPGGAHIITGVSVRAGEGAGYDVLADYLLTRRPEADQPFAIVGVGYYESTVVLDGDTWRFTSHRIVAR